MLLAYTDATRGEFLRGVRSGGFSNGLLSDRSLCLDTNETFKSFDRQCAIFLVAVSIGKTKLDKNTSRTSNPSISPYPTKARPGLEQRITRDLSRTRLHRFDQTSNLLLVRKNRLERTGKPLSACQARLREYPMLQPDKQRLIPMSNVQSLKEIVFSSSRKMYESCRRGLCKCAANGCGELFSTP